jgi:O-antigen/teichoic acid export membrane protein
MTGSRHSIIRGFLSMMSAKVGMLILTLLFTPVIVRLLPKSEYGSYSFVLSFLAIFMIFVGAGSSAGVRKYIAEQRDLNDWQSHVFGFYFRLSIGLAVLGSVVTAVGSEVGLFKQVFGSGVGQLLVVLPGLIISEQLFGLSRNTLIGLSMEHRSEPLKVVQKVLFVVVGAGLAYLGWGALGVLIGHIVANFTVAGIALLFLARRLSITRILSTLPSDISGSTLFSFNIQNLLLVFLTASLTHLDIIMIQTFMNSTQTASYKAALTVAEFILFVPIALQMVFLHSASRLWSEGKTEQVNELSSRATRYNLLLTLLLAVGMSALAREFIGLYFGQGYLGAVTPLLLLLPGVVGYALARPIFAIGQGKGDLGVIIFATGASAVLNAILNALLIPRYGTVGAGFATSVGYGSMLVFHIASARRLGYDPIADLRAGRIITAGVAAAAVIHLLVGIITRPLVALVVVPPTGFVVYSYIALLTGAVDWDDINQLLRSVPPPLDNRLRSVLILLTRAVPNRPD